MIRKNDLHIASIEEGTVIDHIAAGQALKILQVLELNTKKKTVTLGMRLPSHSLGKKDIIKLEKTELSPLQANQLAIFAPDATVSIIEKGHVKHSFKVAMPKVLSKVLSCPNRDCISRQEDIESKFSVREKQTEVELSCHYCEQEFLEEEMER